MYLYISPDVQWTCHLRIDSDPAIEVVKTDQKFGQTGFGKRHFQCQIPSPQSFTEVPVLEKAGNIFGFEYTKVERHLKDSKRTCSVAAKFSFLCDMAISPDGGHWCIVMGRDRKTHQRAQRPELRFKATTKSMRFGAGNGWDVAQIEKPYAFVHLVSRWPWGGEASKKKHPKRKEGSHFHRDQTENLTPKSGLGLENPLKMTQLIQLDVKFDPNSSDLRVLFVLFGNPVISVLPRNMGMVWWAARQFWAPQFFMMLMTQGMT